MGTGLVVCADDFGMSAGVSRAIAELAEVGRISATSCITNCSAWIAEAPRLRSLAGRVGIGLHLTLTWGKPLGAMPELAPAGTFPPLSRLVRRAMSGRLPLFEIGSEIGRQLDAFGAATGRHPDFVDGHQHVHALPGIRRALMAELGERGLAGTVWLRDPTDRLLSAARRPCASKAVLLAALSAGFGETARAAGFRTNRGFSGFSAFRDDEDLPAAFEGYLRALGPSPLVMCHPGHVDDGHGLDAVWEPRERERAFLASPLWPELLAARGLDLTPSPHRGSEGTGQALA